jgi:hypothetical protein
MAWLFFRELVLAIIYLFMFCFVLELIVCWANHPVFNKDEDSEDSG